MVVFHDFSNVSPASNKYGVMLDVSMWNFRKLISKKIYSRISPRSFQASSHKLRRDSLCLCRAKRSWGKFFSVGEISARFFCCFSVRRHEFSTKKTPQKNRNLCDTLEKFAWNENLMRWTLSSFSTQHAQRCVPARSVVTQWVCYPENHVNAFFWTKEPHWRRWGLPGTQNRTAAANAFFRFTNRLLQLVLLNSCLDYCCLRNCLRPERSPPASGMGSPPLFRGPRALPPCQRQRRTPRPQRIA